jgi:hypothetical protein
MTKLYVRLHIRELVAEKSGTASIRTARRNFQKTLASWRLTQFKLFPTLLEGLGNQDEFKEPEAENLLLPSHMTIAEQERHGLADLAKIEFHLREGQAHDALEEVRLAIKTFNYNLKFKIKNVRGQGANTRAQAFLATLNMDKLKSAKRYRLARNALIALGLPTSDLSFQPLNDSDLWAKDSSRPSKLGDTKTEEPWFWTVGRPSGLSVEEEVQWSLERELSFSHLI